jgi:tetratricopeptide (TPR) repeat protein
MNKIIFLFAVLLFTHNISFAQTSDDKIVFVVDSITVMDNPEDGNEILQMDVADLTVIKNKDSLSRLGFGQYDGVTYIFTKEYRNRPDSLKKIPSLKQMERKNGVFLFHSMPYSGRFIDYYYSGRKQGEGTFLNGKVNGHRKMYYQNGIISVEKDYKEGMENGVEIEYYEDGSIKQKGELVNGKEDGIWDKYFPNGQIKQRSIFINGVMNGETTVYYSTGKVLAVEMTKNGKASPDKRLEKINQILNKGNESNKEEDYKNAIKIYSKAIELDSTFAEAYFSRGTAKLNDLQFDEAIADFDKALKFEPFMTYALANRASARIRKYQFRNSRTISKTNGITVLASKDDAPIPEDEKVKICDDLKKVMFLGEKSKMITEARSNYCPVQSSH